MKSKEVFLNLVALVLLVTAFCIVTFTAHYTHQGVRESVRQSKSDPGKTKSNGTLIHRAADASGKTAEQAESTGQVLTASVRPPNRRPAQPKREQQSADMPDTSRLKESQLRWVTSNGRDYLEDTTGAMDCNEIDQRAIETIE